MVDENNQAIGQAPKLLAHQTPLLHRAFSVIIFNSKGQSLLQRRAMTKYHSPGKWSNTCCSHPQPGEATPEAAERRLQEELGFTTGLTERFSFIYKFEDKESGLWEHEYDTVYTGLYDETISMNEAEVMSVQWIDSDALDQWITKEPEAFAFWFKILWKEYREQTT